MQVFSRAQLAHTAQLEQKGQCNLSTEDDSDILMMQGSFDFHHENTAMSHQKDVAYMDCDDQPREMSKGTCKYTGAKDIVGTLSRASTTSVSSIMSSTSSSASLVGDAEPELSQSFGSTRSYDLVTPSKYGMKALYPVSQQPFRHEARWSAQNQCASSSSSSSTIGQPSSSPSSSSMSRALSCSSPSGSPRTAATSKQTRDDSSKHPYEKPFLYGQTLRMQGTRPPGLAGFLKLDIQSKSGEGPTTPGGRVAAGARDGAGDSSRPVSPFEPPTPLISASDRAVFGSQAPATPLAPGQSPTRPKILYRHTAVPQKSTPLSNVMSPLQETFSVVGIHASKMKSRSNTPSEASTSMTSNSSACTLLTPPFSPYFAAKQLSVDGTDSLIEERRGSLSSLSSGSSSCVAGRSVSPRAKVSKGKVNPYPLPTRDESQTSKATSSIMVSSKSQILASQQDYFAPKSSVTEAPKPVLLSKAPRMEKCHSEPVPQTVSARHLMGRNLHPKFIRDYRLGDELGSGGFGFVVSATRIDDQRPVAVKFIWRNKVPSHGWVRDEEFGAIPMEAFVLRVIDSPFVVKYIDLLADKDFFYLIQELHGSPWKAPSSEDGSAKAKSKAQPAVAQASLSSANTAKSQKKSEALAPIDTNTSSGSRKDSLQLNAIDTSKTCTAPSPTVAIFPPESNEPLPGEPKLASSPGALSEASFCDEDMNESALSDSSGPSIKALRPAPLERRSSCDLFECIEQHSYFSEDRARWIFAQIVEAVYELDKKGICHRDIKDENCVVDRDFNVKLIDFGSAVVMDPRRPPPYFNRFFGTMTFAPSEILQGKQYRAPHAEIWSLGVLLSILLTGECPFSDPRDAVRGRLSRPTDKFTAEALDLLMACIVVDPDQRATIRQVRHHPWVEKAWTQQRQGKRPDGSCVSAPQA